MYATTRMPERCSRSHVNSVVNSSRSFHHRDSRSDTRSECRELIPGLVLRLVPRRLPCALTELSVYALLRADYQQQHAARSELPGDPAPAPRSATVRSEPPGTPDPRLRRRCPQGNTYNTPGGTNSNGGSSYHYSNSNGSYYYANDNGSTYYHPPPSSSAPPVYTPPPSK